ncbi:MAG: hypothetical protein ACAI38_13115 [Myxococcota bacterium]
MGLRQTSYLLVLLAAGCSGTGDGSSDPGDGDQDDADGASGDDDAGLTLVERTAAATETAQTNAACANDALPEGFYWEIGDRDGMLASGSVSGTNTPTPSQVIAVASASKWIYSTYVLEKIGSLRESDVPFLNFTSGMVFPLAAGTKEAVCGATETVGECAAAVVEQEASVGNFHYSAGHFQYHATNTMGLGDLGASALTSEIVSVLGGLDFTYLQTNLAGGLNTSASAYAAFLRRLLRGEYVMADHLGENKVCASSACAAGAVLSPAPTDEAWNYSLGHWVEDDPTLGDHAFSSAGALGFYPWIDSSKTWYGVVARRAASPGGSQGVVSLRCGRLIRQAWVTGLAVTP